MAMKIERILITRNKKTNKYSFELDSYAAVLSQNMPNDPPTYKGVKTVLVPAKYSFYPEGGRLLAFDNIDASSLKSVIKHFYEGLERGDYE